MQQWNYFEVLQEAHYPKKDAFHFSRKLPNDVASTSLEGELTTLLLLLLLILLQLLLQTLRQNVPVVEPTEFMNLERKYLQKKFWITCLFFSPPQGFKGESSSSGEEEIQPLAVVSSSPFLPSWQQCEGCVVPRFQVVVFLFCIPCCVVVVSRM